ncbi:subclass B1 metallo-beta-lactamase [Flavobacterium jejuense]|uniref:subclass B1 metallo-beta-lactamase n=1 Tax=Flavobacterium jejuense TaxID=1544455 RepID=UPI00293C07B4|nr:subclass B1 metallo-beta-lactamase [Flavobacterium jejuense]
MRSPIKLISFSLTLLFLISCNATKKLSLSESKTSYQTENITIIQISQNVYQHISYLNTTDFGKVACNGMVIKSSNEAIVFDTAVDDKSSEELINWINKTLNCKIKAMIPTHFHDDCLGGIKAFNRHEIPTYAFYKTVQFAKKKNIDLSRNSFQNELELKVGNENVIIQFFGEGHTKDNVIGYFPKEKILFGGCMIKEINGGKGNLSDANVKDWSATVTKVKEAFPNIKIVIPGHGEFGNIALLDYTIALFKPESEE